MQSGKTNERRQSVDRLISNMFDERKQLLALLFQVSTVEKNGSGLQIKDVMEEFCQILVDYIAAGHFELYDRIVAGKERRKVVAELAEKIYPEIEQTTNIALEFSEKYNNDNKSRDSTRLKNDLSILGEALTTRIELEDQLISKLTNKSVSL